MWFGSSSSMPGLSWPLTSRTLDRETLRRRGHRIAQRRRRRALPRLDSPQALLEGRPLFEIHAIEQVHPPIRARVDEKLDLRSQRQLILGREERDLHTTIGRKRNLETRHGVAHIGERQYLTRP